MCILKQPRIKTEVVLVSGHKVAAKITQEGRGLGR